MQMEKGSVSINTENIFPIIKKWLYSDKDIFLRELISNSADAISKHKRLVGIGEAKEEKDEKYKIRIEVNKKEKTIKVIDNGIGMTADEVKKYINQIAFSGARDFLEKYKEDDKSSQIIGHFGLGFYSAFMVADKVQIDTKSWQKDSEAVKWTSDGGTEYEMDASARKSRGTTITLYISKDEKELLDQVKIRQTLKKYCSFMPFEIFIGDDTKPINNTSPLWLKRPSECKEEEYKEFYREVFMDFQEPLFWIHLNMDYPFKLKGILYFPKLKHEFEPNEGQIKLFYNQVFVADNIKEVIPEFLMLLKGVIDCPDLPLNVSRSFLQNDGYVNKISNHITKKVASKLKSLYNKERDNYNKYWDDINPFVKYGCLREEKFYDRVKDIIIFKTTKDDYVTLSEYLERNRDKHENKVYYANDEGQQSQYINMFKEHGMEAVKLPSLIDNHFIQFLEMKNTDVKFSRVDADIIDSLKEDGDNEQNKKHKETLEKIFKKALNNKELKVEVQELKSESIPAVIMLPEQSRRMQEMSRMYGGMNMPGGFPSDETLVINTKNPIIKKVLILDGSSDRKEDINMVVQHVYDLAVLQNKPMTPDAMTEFIKRSNSMLERIV